VSVAAGDAPRGWLNRTVAAFGLTSLLSDVGHEMATSVLPLQLARLGLGATALGAIEGIADAVSGLSKLAGGAAGQRIARKKPWTAAGYAVTAVCTSALGFVGTLPMFVALRSAAWAGRGFRGPLRDFLVSDSVLPRYYARAFGLERAGDMIGAVAGPLLALSLLAAGVAFKSVLLVAVAPGLLAAGCVLWLVKERVHDPAAARAARLRPVMPRGYWPLVTSVLVFGLGDFSRSFLILAVAKAAPVVDDGKAVLFGLPVLLYALHNGVSALATFPSGNFADRFGRRRVLAAGYLLGLGVNLTLALGSHALAAVCFAFLLSGIAIAVEETVEKACVAEMLPRESRSYGLGVLATANAVGDMVSSVAVGLLWDRMGAGVAFGSAAACSTAGLLLLVGISRPRDRGGAEATSSSSTASRAGADSGSASPAAS
jgi:MFS family permease